MTVKMDTAFLKETIGPVLVSALLEVALMRPSDPIEHLSNLLLKVQQNEDERAQAEINKKALEAARLNEEEKNRIEAERRSREAAEHELAMKEDKERRHRAKAQKNIQQCQQYALMMAKKRHELEKSIPKGYDAAHSKFLQENTKYFKKIVPSSLYDQLEESPQLAAFTRAYLLLFNYDAEFLKSNANTARVLRSKRFVPELARMEKSMLRNSERNLRRMTAALKDAGPPEDLYKFDLSIAIMDEFMKGYAARFNGSEANAESQINSETVTEDFTSDFGKDKEEQPHEFAGTLPVLDQKTLEFSEDETYTIKLGWEMVNDQTVDLDAAIICYDKIGSVLDTVYFNKLQSKDGAIRHHGDENDAAREEVLDFIPSKVEQNISSICLVLNCNKEGHSFKDVLNCSFTVQAKDGTLLAAHSSKGQFPHTAYLLAILNRSSDGLTWNITLIGEPAKDDEDDGTNFMDASPVCVRFMEDMGIIPISSRSKRQCSNPYAMEKHESYDVPPNLSKVHIGLGWNVVDGHKFDVDCSVVLFGNGELIDFVNFDKLVSNDRAIIHTGDNMTGEVEGDDEAVKMDYSAIAKEIDTLFFVVNIYQEGTFDHVAGTFIRMVDEAGGKELCRYSVPTEAGGYNGLILSKLVRQTGEGDKEDTWKMITLGHAGHGSTYEELLPDMQELIQADVVDDAVTQN